VKVNITATISNVTMLHSSASRFHGTGREESHFTGHF
jgi:hypothetical protein